MCIISRLMLGMLQIIRWFSHKTVSAYILRHLCFLFVAALLSSYILFFLILRLYFPKLLSLLMILISLLFVVGLLRIRSAVRRYNLLLEHIFITLLGRMAFA